MPTSTRFRFADPPCSSEKPFSSRWRLLVLLVVFVLMSPGLWAQPYTAPAAPRGNGAASGTRPAANGLLRVTTLPPLAITTLSPTRNQRSAPASANVAVTFDQSLQNTATTQQAVRVFSQQCGGRMSGTTGGVASVSGNTLTFDPTTDFRPGEKVLVTTTTDATSTGSSTLTRGHVHQFTVAAGGTGEGNFQPPMINPSVRAQSSPYGVAVGDIDGDGDLDFVATQNGFATLCVRINDGTGNFTPHPTNPTPTVSNGGYGVVLGDLDHDGDLDLLAANSGTNTVSVRFNNGTGSFTPPPTNADMAVGAAPRRLALGDLDADGDLDFVVTSNSTSIVNVRLNNGSGSFTPHATNPNPTVGSFPGNALLGDLDADGDLDLISVNLTNVSVRLNDGTGNFTAPATGHTLPTGSTAAADLGDVDGDGDLDLIAVSSSSSGAVSLFLNNGTGVLIASATPPMPDLGFAGYNMTLGDIDADDDLDLLVTHAVNRVSVRLNDGTGTFTTPALNGALLDLGLNPSQIVLGDLDADGDLDIVCGSLASFAVEIRLNQPVATSIASFSPTSGPVGTVVFVTGVNVADATAVEVNGTPGTITAKKAPNLTFMVGPGSTTGPLSITTPTGTATAGTFTVTPALAIAAISPLRLQTTATPATDVRVEFDQPITNTAATRQAVRVFSQQRGGRMGGTSGGTASVSGPALAFNPATDFHAGETLSVTTTREVVGSNGATLPVGHVHQFTTATGGTGIGNFQPPAINPTPSVGSASFSIALGDVDGDGDLDFVTGNVTGGGVASVRANDGTGNFTVPAVNPTSPINSNPGHVTLADVDGDGDLDVLAANSGKNTIAVRLNDGTGTFLPPSANADVAVGSSSDYCTLADVDGDGDLDLMVPATDNQISLRLNDGTGYFYPAPVNPKPSGGNRLDNMAVGDLDNDGDLDILTPMNSTVLTRLNDGTGNFSAPATNASTSIGGSSRSLAMGDLDGDGDLDFVSASATAQNVSVRLNDGTGAFSAPASGPEIAVGRAANQLRLADIDHDGDLDFAFIGSGSTAVTLYLNDGAGNFTVSAYSFSLPASTVAQNIAFGDVDHDDDVDLLVAANTAIHVYLNQPAPPNLTSASTLLGPEGTTVTLTGTGFVAGTTLQFNGTAAVVTVVNETQLIATVPVGATSGLITVRNERGTAASASAFEVLPIYSGTFNSCLSSTAITSTGSGQWQYLRASTGELVAALNDQGHALGTVSIDFYLHQGAVRSDTEGREYFDRNWKINAQNAFTGQQVRVRLYARNAEFTAYQAANDVDGNDVTSRSQLRLTQYSGPNEDCQLANNHWASADTRLLTPAAVEALAGANWFALETVIADHFSEFFLNGGTAPLPVELVRFAADRKDAHTVSLTWATAAEKANRGFVVERSVDGRTFESISELLAGRGTASTYAWTDRRALAVSTTYYRLLQVDTDVTRTTSGVVAVGVLAGGTPLALAPNPARETLTIQPPTGATEVVIVDALGRAVLTVPTPTEGRVTVRLPLPSGVYTVRAGRETTRLVVE